MSSNSPDPKYAQYPTEQLEQLLGQTREAGESNRIKEELKRRFAEQYVNMKVDPPAVAPPAATPATPAAQSGGSDFGWGCLIFIILALLGAASKGC